MSEFIKKNIYLILLFIITLSIGFLTFLTFIDKGFVELSDQNLQFLLILNIALLFSLFIFINNKLFMFFRIKPFALSRGKYNKIIVHQKYWLINLNVRFY